MIIIGSVVFKKKDINVKKGEHFKNFNVIFICMFNIFWNLYISKNHFIQLKIFRNIFTSFLKNKNNFNI